MCSTYYSSAFQNPIFFKELVLRTPSLDNEIFFKHVIDLHGHHLTALDLSFCHIFVQDSLLRPIFRTCHSLKTCILWACHDITDDSISELATCCVNLKVLNVSGCFRLTNDSISQVSANLLRLEILNLSGCIRLTDDGIANLYQTSRLVQTLEDSPYPTPEVLETLPSQYRRFSCVSVKSRRIDANVFQFIVHFQDRPKVINRWISQYESDKYKPFFHHGNITYKGKCEDTILKVLNVSQCQALTSSWHDRMQDIHPGIHIVK